MACAVVGSACTTEESVRQLPDLQAIRAQEPRSELYDFEYLFTELGKPKALLKAPYARDFYRIENQETEIHLPKGMEIAFFDSTGAETSRMTARQGTLFQNKGFAEAVGQVVWTNQKQERLETERLRWFRQLNQVSTPEFVKITTPTDVLFGDSLVANLNFSTYRIFKIRGQFLLDESKNNP